MRNNLINVRKNKDLTQSQVADALGISVRQYRRLEAGTSNGSVENWLNLKKIFGVKSIDFLLEQEVQNQNTTKNNDKQ